jgi:glycosyltransferase involved in cell wall biosynthesis
MIKKLSIVIPAYNEGPTIHHILDKVKEVRLLNDIEKEVIVVNAARMILKSPSLSIRRTIKT